jgi:Xaa-Pro aminopeptidase
MPDHAARLAAFRARLLAADLSGAFLPESADVEYLTGVPRARNVNDPAWDRELDVEGCFIGLDAGPLFLFTHSEWSLPAAAAAARWDARHMPADGEPARWLADAARACGVGARLGVGDRTTLRQLGALRRALPDAAFVPCSEHVLALRAAKDAWEVDRIRAAGALAVAALERTLPRFGTSFRRSDFLIELEHQLMVGGSQRAAYAPDIYAAGPATRVVWSADALGEPDAPVRAPAAVSVDWGAVVDGYRSDVGRTIYVGEPPPGAVDALAAVRAGQEAAIAALAPGAGAAAVDAAARRVLVDAGLGDAFWIPAGHGIGLEIHEPPRLRDGSPEVLVEGAVVTVEIAAWRDGEVSAFWEDDVFVGAGRAERLTAGPDDAYVIA